MGTAGKFAYAELTLQSLPAATRYFAKTGSCVFQQFWSKIGRISVFKQFLNLNFTNFPFYLRYSNNNLSYCHEISVNLGYTIWDSVHCDFIACFPLLQFIHAAVVHMSSLSPPQSLLNGKTSALSGPGGKGGQARNELCRCFTRTMCSP